MRRIKNSGKNPSEEVSNICSASDSMKTKAFHATMCWVSGTVLCVGMEIDFLFLAPVQPVSILCPTLLISGWKYEVLRIKPKT